MSDSSQPQDSERIARLKSALSQTTHPQLHQLDVVLCDGGVVLSGRVPSFYLKQLATEKLRETGVAGKINNHVVVRDAP